MKLSNILEGKYSKIQATVEVIVVQGGVPFRQQEEFLLSVKHFVELLQRKKDTDIPDWIREEVNDTVEDMNFRKIDDVEEVAVIVEIPKDMRMKKNKKGDITMIVVDDKKYYV